MGFGDIFKKLKGSNDSKEKRKSTTNAKSFSEFTYLINNILNNWGSYLALDSDYSFSIRKDGADPISIVGNELEIDGKGHIIDGNGRNRLMYIKGYDIVLKNFTFQNAVFYDYFSAIFIDKYSKVTFLNCEFINNKSENGGVIKNRGELILVDCKFKNNSSKESGGAIINHSDLNIKKSIFSGNKSSIGGAICNDINGKLTIEDCKFCENSVSASSINAKAQLAKGLLDVPGGAIVNRNISIINNTLFKYNSAIMGGAIKNEDNASMGLYNCKFLENKSKVNGGALVNFGTINIRQNTSFIDNFANEDGGAINNQKSGKINILNSNFKNNESNHNGGAITNVGSLKISDSNLSSNETSKNGGAIYNSDYDLDIVNCEFKCNSCDDDGGAIINWGKLTISNNSKFIDNSSRNRDGGAIYNNGTFKLSDTEFIDNYSKNSGGAIYNENKMKVNSSKFISNNAGNEGYSIFNGESIDLNIDNSQFLNNNNDSNCIFNQGLINIRNSFFSNNDSNSLIYNDKNSSLEMYYCKFSDNKSKLSAIYNFGKSARLVEIIFKNNTSQINYANNIYNKTKLILVKAKIDEKSYPTILNDNKIEVSKLSREDAKNFINGGTVEFDDGDFNVVGDFPTSDSKDFKYLYDLIITSNDNVIYLEDDFIFKKNEIPFFEGGIELNGEELHINGNGHVIDGGGKSRIFLVSGKNIILENITFKNGHLFSSCEEHSDGGAALRILKDASLTLKNCKFLSCFSEVDGGAILNRGHLESISNEFNDIGADLYGGAIHNQGLVISTMDRFDNSSSKFGACIYNEDILALDSPKLNESEGTYIYNPMFNTEYVLLNEDNYNKKYLIANYGEIIENWSKNSLIENPNYLKEEYEKNSVSFNQFLKSLDTDYLELYKNVIFDIKKDKERYAFERNRDKSNIVIEGYGHSIDANHSSGFFGYSLSKFNKVHFKNIVFKNGFSYDDDLFINYIDEIIFEECIFKNNHVRGENNVFLNKNEHSKVEFRNCVFLNNSSKSEPIINNLSNAHFINCNFINNYSIDSSIIKNHNGELANYDGKLIFVNSNVINNYSNSASSSVIVNQGKMELENSKFYYNKSASSGGVIRASFSSSNEESTINITHCDFRHNTTSIIGGVLINFAKVFIINSNFFRNHSHLGASAIYNEPTGYLEIKNTIFEKNSSDNNSFMNPIHNDGKKKFRNLKGDF